MKEGDVVPVKLVRIEKDRHRLGLSLRQARNDAEAMGFVFDSNGAVIDYPDDVREQFGLPERDKSMPTPAQRNAERPAAQAIEQAGARDPEPVSAFAHAFAQALENAEPGSAFMPVSEPVATPEPVVEPALEVKTEDSAEPTKDSAEATPAEATADAEEPSEATTPTAGEESANTGEDATTVGT